MLVVIGVIVILAAILLPMLLKANREGDRMRTQADMQTISQGLEAYKLDFGDYPRPDSPGNNSGFACLGRYLIGPGPAGAPSPTFTLPVAPFKDGDMYYVGSGTTQIQYVCVNGSSTTTAPPTPDWVVQSFTDSVDGPGIKGPHGNKKYGPYIQPDKVRLHGLAIVDKKDNPILYFPATAGHPNIHVVGGGGTSSGYLSLSGASMYNLGDGENFFREQGEPDISNPPTMNYNSVHAMMSLLGDTNFDGAIGPGETAAATGSYILWAAGPDGIYGPVRSPNADATQEQLDSCDDVTNFK
jgi:type II secretory pathway pseudopilin PulG